MKGRSRSARLWATRKEVFRLLIPGPIGIGLGAMLVAGGLDKAGIVTVSLMTLLLWVPFIALATISSIVVAIAFLARRAVWIPVLRSAFLLLFMLSLAVAGILVIVPIAPAWLTLAFITIALCAFFAAALYSRAKLTKPYWREMFEANTRGKIDLRTGVFSVTTPWAMSNQQWADWVKWGGLLSLIPLAAAFGEPLLRLLSGFSGATAVTAAIFTAFAAGSAGFSEAEAYFAARLLEIERQIGKPLIMDGYQPDGRSA